MSRYAALYARLGYVFSDEALLQHALTHRSYGPEHNERLEFLGDSLLNMIVTDVLFSRYPGLDEGELSRMRAALVSGKTLAQVATELQLGDSLRLGAGERNSGGHRRSSTLADAVEALLGAVYLEAGMQACRDCVMRWFASRLDQLDPTASHKDAKTRLQEFLQSRKLPLPVYEVVDISGKDHDQTFVVHCQIESLGKPMKGTGTSRRKAEQQAARNALEKLDDD